LRCSDWREGGGVGRGCETESVPLASAQPLGDQGNPPLHGEGNELDGFSTLKALGLDWQQIEALTLCARTPSGGGHAWFKPVSGKSRTLGSGVEWFSKGKYVVVPPAQGRDWLNNLPVAEAPEELQRIVLANHIHRDAGKDFLGPLMSGAIASSSKVPKPIYFLILRLMPMAHRRDQRRAAGLFNVVASKRSGRNNALNFAAWAFRELVEGNAIKASGATALLIEACKANGYLAKDGEEAVRATIMSGLGLKEWPEDGELKRCG
jgi:Bifunctional DNA primase/polymerase, N-terminal